MRFAREGLSRTGYDLSLGNDWIFLRLSGENLKKDFPPTLLLSAVIDSFHFPEGYAFDESLNANSILIALYSYLKHYSIGQ